MSITANYCKITKKKIDRKYFQIFACFSFFEPFYAFHFIVLLIDKYTFLLYLYIYFKFQFNADFTGSSYIKYLCIKF